MAMTIKKGDIDSLENQRRMCREAYYRYREKYLSQKKIYYENNKEKIHQKMNDKYHNKIDYIWKQFRQIGNYGNTEL